MRPYWRKPELKKGKSTITFELAGFKINMVMVLWALTGHSNHNSFLNLQQMGIFNIFFKNRKEKKLIPESNWIVTINNEIINVSDPNGNRTECAIADIDKVIIETTDQGPFYPDVWWKIITKDKRLIIPEGATGEKELLNKMQKLPNFNNEKFIESMYSTSNKEFISWEKVSEV